MRGSKIARARGRGRERDRRGRESPGRSTLRSVSNLEKRVPIRAKRARGAGATELGAKEVGGRSEGSRDT